MKNKIFLYMLVEGVSRGIPQLVLMTLAFIITKQEFAILILLYGLESLIVILLPSNYIEVLYKINNDNNNAKIINSIFTFNLMIIMLILIIYLIFSGYIHSFFNYDYTLVFICIIISAFVNSFMRFYRVQLQLLLKHNSALKSMIFSFGFSNLFMIIGILIFEDKILGFFMGKAIGFILYLIYLIYIDDLKILFSKFVFYYFIIRVRYLLLFAIYSWLFGYGFTYMINLFGSLDDVANIGYLITFSMPFLLLANGINQVYNPKIRNLIKINLLDAFTFSKQVMLYYFIISFSLFLIIYVISFINIEIVSKYIVYFIISSIIFLFSTYKYIYEIYLYVNDMFKPYILTTIFIETLALVLILSIYKIWNYNIIYLYPILILSRNITICYFIKTIKRRI